LLAVPTAIRRGDEVAETYPSELSDALSVRSWLLARPERAENLLKPKNQPQPMFFNPF